MYGHNPFKDDYPFKKLIQVHPDLSKYVFLNEYGTKTIRFADLVAVMLSKSSIAISEIQY